jgi:hypothetical protein
MIEHIFRGKTYNFYSPEEAEQEGITYTSDPYVATEGEWILTSDNWVVPLLRNRRFKGKAPGGYIRIPTGTFLYGKGPNDEPITIEPREHHTSFLGKGFREKDASRPLTQKERKFVMHFLQHFDIPKAFAEATTWNPKAKTFRREAYAYAKRANVQMAIDEGIRLRLQGVGINEEWFGEQLKRIVSEAPRYMDQVRGLELAAKVLDLVTPAVTERSAFIGIATTEVQKLESERREILADGGDEIGRLGEGAAGEAGASPEDGPGHRAIREADVSESPVQEDPRLP